MKTILVDPSRCIQCCNCQNACKDEHCDNDWSPTAAPQGPGQFWIKVHESQAADGARMRLNRVPVLCQHCENPACEAACPNGAISRRDDGIVLIDPERCQGCGACRDACPYDVIYENTERGISQKCTMCAHLLDAGWERPRCVTACPSDALSFVDEDDLAMENLTAPLERLHPEYDTAPRVAYVNLPKPFVAGAVYSPAEDLCLEKVNLELVGQANGAYYLGRTGLMGEFRIEGVEPGFYTLNLEKDGYDAKAIASLDVREALNAGEIKLVKSAQ